MASPSFNQAAHYSQLTGVTDVQEIIDELTTLLVAIGWTNPGAGVLTSPVNAAGQFITLTLTRIGVGELNATVTDHLGRVTPAGEIQISGTVVVDFAYGIGYVYFENVTPATKEYMLASIQTFSPEPQNSHSGYVYFSALRNSAGSLVGTNRNGITFNFQTGAYDTAFTNLRILCPITQADPTLPGLCMTPTGLRRWFPYIATGIDSDNVNHIRGRIPNFIFIGGTIVQIGSRYVISIDEATTREFLVVGMRDTSNPNGTFAAVLLP